MKEKRVSIQVQRVIYVAEDGMEFTSEFMCKAHEAEMERDRLEDVVSALPRFEFTPEWADSDIVWKWYFISNKEELDAARKVVFFDRDSAAYEYERDDYPAWIAFSVDEEGSGYIVGDLAEVCDMLQSFQNDLLEEANTQNGRFQRHDVSDRQF